jgi:hypothetical protein
MKLRVVYVAAWMAFAFCFTTPIFAATAIDTVRVDLPPAKKRRIRFQTQVR